MLRPFFKVMAIVCLALSMLLTVPAPVYAAGWLNQSQPASPTTQKDQYAQETQYSQEEQYAQEDQYAQQDQFSPIQESSSSTTNHQSNQSFQNDSPLKMTDSEKGNSVN